MKEIKKSYSYSLFLSRNFITSDHEKRYLFPRQLLTIMADTAVPLQMILTPLDHGYLATVNS